MFKKLNIVDLKIESRITELSTKQILIVFPGTKAVLVVQTAVVLAVLTAAVLAVVAGATVGVVEVLTAGVAEVLMTAMVDPLIVAVLTHVTALPAVVLAVMTAEAAGVTVGVQTVEVVVEVKTAEVKDLEVNPYPMTAKRGRVVPCGT